MLAPRRQTPGSFIAHAMRTNRFRSLCRQLAGSGRLDGVADLPLNELQSPPDVERMFSTKYLGRDFTASIVVFLVAMPLCMGIADRVRRRAAEKGLITGIIGGMYRRMRSPVRRCR